MDKFHAPTRTFFNVCVQYGNILQIYIFIGLLMIYGEFAYEQVYLTKNRQFLFSLEIHETRLN